MKIAVAVCGATSGRAEERAAAAQVENTGLMSGRVHTEVEIQASAERVWAILSDLSDYPSWNPFVRQISGILRKDERLKVTLQPPGGRAMSFRPAVIVAETNRAALARKCDRPWHIRRRTLLHYRATIRVERALRPG